jgi:predicted ATPase
MPPSRPSPQPEPTSQPAPPVETLAAARHNLPVALTSFVGREQEVAEVKALLGRTRLLTLTGTGGCGKTRLAVQVAADLVEDVPDGVWLVDLAPLGEPALVPQTTATALAVREVPGQPILTTLLTTLTPKHLLVILDNCEHLIEACARLVDALLHRCPRLQVLATSREALGIAGELAWRVPSLAVPAVQPVPPLDELVQYEAVRLFVERATLVQPGFAVTPQNAAAVGQVCRRLDGCPSSSLPPGWIIGSGC